MMKNILLVENDDMSIKLILYFLKNLYKTDVAKDGITALHMVKEKKYSAVLMDIDLGPHTLSSTDDLESIITIRVKFAFSKFFNRSASLISAIAFEEKVNAKPIFLK